MFDVLSPKQNQVAKLIAEGLSNKEIARIMNLSPRTVEDYKTTLYKRLEVKNLAQLVRRVVMAELTAT